MISGFAQPGAGMRTILSSMQADIKKLKRNNIVVVWGGANDIGRNNSRDALTHLCNFIEDNQHVNIIVLTAPHRHDLIASSCVNVEVNNYNRRLIKRMVPFKNVKILATSLERKYFTRHGMHLNALGKERVARGTAMVIRSFRRRNKTPLTSLDWKDGTSVPDPSGIEPLVTLSNPELVPSSQPVKSSASVEIMMKGSNTSDNADNSEPPNNLVTVPCDSCVSSDPGRNDVDRREPPQLDTASKIIITITEEKGDDLIDLHTQVTTENEQLITSLNKSAKSADDAESVTPPTPQHEGLRKSSRTKKAPQTRNDDFLWT
jgi:hypothetical protein